MDDCKNKHEYKDGFFFCATCQLVDVQITMTVTREPLIGYRDEWKKMFEKFKDTTAPKGFVIKPLKIEPLQIPDLKFSVKTLDLGMPCICSMQTLMRNGCECEGK